MTTQRARSCLVMALAVAACAPRSQPPRARATWAVGQAPTVVIADVPGHEFRSVSSALRLADAQILVADAGVPELSLFDSAGRFVRPIGRKGRGPGEFQGPIAVFRWRADSVAVYDLASVRWTILDPALGLARTRSAPDAAIRQPTWLYQGAIVNDGVQEAVPSWVLSVLADARRADPEYRQLLHARRDDLGALWIRDSVDRSRWAVYTDSGAAKASVRLPAGLEPLEIGPDFVLGLERDSLDVERLTVRTLERGPVAVATHSAGVAALPGDSAVIRALTSLVMPQEMYYAYHATYAANRDSLKLPAPFPYRLFILAGDARHWGAVAVVEATGTTCGLSVGWPSPVGWLDGAAFCGR